MYLFGEEERDSWGGTERGEERVPSRHCTFSTESDVGLKFANCEIMIQAEIESQTPNRLSHPGPGSPKLYLSWFNQDKNSHTPHH